MYLHLYWWMLMFKLIILLFFYYGRLIDLYVTREKSISFPPSGEV
jgi:hypothetical protein